jgi:hypothetical protein
MKKKASPLPAKSQILSTLSIELAAPIRATLSLETQVPPIGSTPSSKSKCVKIGPTLSDQSLAPLTTLTLAVLSEKATTNEQISAFCLELGIQSPI